MCCDEGRLLVYLDGELDDAGRAEVEAHVRACDECAAVLTRLEDDRTVAAAALGRLHDAAEHAPVTPPATTPALSAVPDAAEPEPRRVRAAVARIGWTRLAGIAAALLFALSFSLAPVRTAAADLLKVFRVQKMQTITISEQDLRQMGNAIQRGGHVDMKALGEAWVDGVTKEPTVMTLAKAEAAVDFPVVLPDGVKGSPKLTLQPAQDYKFKLNVGRINEVLSSYGATKLLPEGLDGKVFEVKIPAVLIAMYGAEADSQTVLVGQARSPELIVPAGVDAAELRDVLLGLPFLPDNVRSQLASVNDWQHTLLIPNIGGTSKDIQINGKPAVVITPSKAAPGGKTPDMMADEPVPGSGAAPGSAVVWNTDGVVRGVAAPDEETAVRLAKTMMR